MQRKAKGFFEQDTDELYYTIDNLYEMEDFFLTIPSSVAYQAEEETPTRRYSPTIPMIRFLI